MVIIIKKDYPFCLSSCCIKSRWISLLDPETITKVISEKGEKDD